MGCRFGDVVHARQSETSSCSGTPRAAEPLPRRSRISVVVVQLLRAGHVTDGAREHELAGILEPLAGGFQGGVLARPHADAGGARGDAGGIGVGITLAALRARADVLVVGEGVHRGAVELGDHVANTRAASLAHRGLALHLRAGARASSVWDPRGRRSRPRAPGSRGGPCTRGFARRAPGADARTPSGHRRGRGSPWRAVRRELVSEAASDDQKRADSDGVPTGDWAPSSICI